MSDAGRASRGIKMTLAGQGVKFALQLASTVLLARLLTPQDFGVFAMVAAVTGFASLLGDFGLSTAAIQAATLSRVQRSNLFWLNAAIGLALFAAFLALSEAIEQFYGQPGLAEVVRWMSFSFVLAALTSQFTAHLTRSLHFGRLSIVDISAQAAGLAAALLVAASGGGYWSLVAQQLAVSSVALALTAGLSMWIPGLPARAPMRALIDFARNSLGVQVLSYVSGNADSVALGRVAGAEALGLYDRAYQLFKIPVQQIAAPLTRVALPILSRHQGDRKTMSRYVVAAQTGVAYVLGAAFSLGAALAAPIVEIALGSKWLEAAPLFTILAIGGIFQVMGYVYYWTFLACGLTGLQLKFSIITRSLMVALIIAGAFGGAYGVAIAVSAGLAVNWIVLSLFPMKKTGLDVRAIVTTGLRASVLNLAVACIVTVADRFIWSDVGAPVRVLLGLVLASVAYGLVVLTTKPVRNDVRTLVKIAKRRK